MSSGDGHVLITGASGFVGRNLVSHFTAAGMCVTSVSRRQVPPIGSEQSVIVEDYATLADRPDLLRANTTVVHLADQAERKNYKLADRHNSAALVGLLASAAAASGARGFVFASSIYADSPSKSAYGQSKHLAEIALSQLAEEFDLAISLRFPPIYGPGAGGMVGILAEWIGKRRALPLGRAIASRRFLGIENLAMLIQHVCRTDHAARGIFSPADPSPISLRGLAHEIARVNGDVARMLPVPYVDRLAPASIIAPDVFVFNREKLEKAIGWSPPRALGDQLNYLRRKV